MAKRGARTSSSDQRRDRPSHAPSLPALKRASSLDHDITEQGVEQHSQVSSIRPDGGHEPVEVGRDAHETQLLEAFFSWPPPPGPEFVPPKFEPPRMSRESRRAMWASILMLVVSVPAIAGYFVYQHVVMPQPVELGEWSDRETPEPASEAAAPSAEPLRFTASLQDPDEAPPPRLAVVEAGDAPAASSPDVAVTKQALVAQPSAAPATPGAQAPAATPSGAEPERSATPSAAAAPATAAQPASFEHELARARQLAAQGEPRQALPAFDRALAQRAYSVDALLGKASALLALKEYDSAKSIAEQAVAMDSKSGDGLLLIGSIYEQLGSAAAAKQTYERCVEQAGDRGAACRERLAQLEAAH
jgi:hypothetical protein